MVIDSGKRKNDGVFEVFRPWDVYPVGWSSCALVVLAREVEGKVAGDENMNPSISYIVHADPRGGYWAEVPDIPGCVTEADTPEELAFMVRDAVRGCLAAYLARMRREAPRRRISRNAQMATVAL